jgi:hypothetical protein
MPDSHDFDLMRAPDGQDIPPARRPIGVWFAVAALVIAAGIAAYFALGGGTPPATIAELAPEASEPVVEPLGTDVPDIEVPPLAESDPLVRELVRALSTHPQVLAWLATDGLIRNFAVVVSNIAEGVTPSGHLAVLKPRAGFAVVEEGGNVFVDPQSYARYDALTAAASSIDPEGAARLYTTLKPRLQEAYGELGFGDVPFDRALERAITMLLATPIPGEALRVEPRGIGYGYVEPRLEQLTGAQKQLLRFGPRNARAVQDALRDIARALGIAENRLPAAGP